MAVNSCAIVEGLPNHLRPQAAALFLQTFDTDLRPAVGVGPRAHRFVAEALSPAHMIHLSDVTGCQGLLGLQWNGRGVFQTNALGLMRHFPWISVPRRLRHLNSFARATDPDEVMLEGFCIAPDFQGQGFGSKMLEAAIARARRLDAAFMSLDVAHDNQAAHQFYCNRGFVEGPSKGRLGTRTLVRPI